MHGSIFFFITGVRWRCCGSMAIQQKEGVQLRFLELDLLNGSWASLDSGVRETPALKPLYRQKTKFVIVSPVKFELNVNGLFRIWGLG